MTVTLRRLSPLVAAAIGALAIATAAPAHGSANPTQCRDRGGTMVCQKQGHSSLQSSPTVRAPSQGLLSPGWLPGYGRGHLPPIIALG